MQHLLCGGALAGVFVEQRSHKLLGFRANAIPRLPCEIHLIAEYGLPAAKSCTVSLTHAHISSVIASDKRGYSQFVCQVNMCHR